MLCETAFSLLLKIFNKQTGETKGYKFSQKKDEKIDFQVSYHDYYLLSAICEQVGSLVEDTVTGIEVIKKSFGGIVYHFNYE